ncbi:MAG: alpha/beta fold hydrolase, partial [Flavisolibacter sp.]
MKVYFISGLAADERAFKHIHLSSHHEVVHLQWIEPLQNESLESYALRLSERIDAKGKFALVGLSFGGMIATEISKLLHPVRTVLISSVPCSQHLPGYYKFAHSLGLHRVVPVSLIK